MGGEYSTAARAFLKVQQIRERTVGGNSVEAATAYHNVAVAFMELSRNREATAYLTLASALFDLLLGDSHPRTLTCRRNLAKAKASKMSMKVEVPHLFYKSFQDLYAEGKKKKGGGKKKKKGTPERHRFFASRSGVLPVLLGRRHRCASRA